MSQYETLDRLIVSRLRHRLQTFNQLDTADIRLECIRIGFEMRRDAFRVLDGRLQALKKRGAIRFNRVTLAWNIADVSGEEGGANDGA